MTAIAVTNTNIVFSPGNWFSNGGGSYLSNNITTGSTYALSNNPGAYFNTIINVTGSGSFVVNLDCSILAGISASSAPVVAWSIDGNTFSTQLLATATTSITLASGLSSGQHTINFYFMSIDLTYAVSNGDRWSNPTTDFFGVKITGFTIDSASNLIAPAALPFKAIWFGDSSLEGAGNIASGAQDAGQTYGYISQYGLSAEIGIVGFSSQGYSDVGFGNVPGLYNSTLANSAWPFYYAGASRTGQPLDWVICTMGINGGAPSATVQGWITQVRSVYPTVKIFACQPWVADNLPGVAGDIQAGVTAYKAANPADQAVYYIGLPTVPLPNTAYWTTYLYHPNLQGDSVFGQGFTGQILDAIGANRIGGGGAYS